MLKIGSIKGKKIELVYVGSDKGRPKGWVGSGSGNAKGRPNLNCTTVVCS